MNSEDISKASTDNINRLGDEEDTFVATIVKELGVSETTLNPWKNNLVTYYELYKMYQRNKHYDGLAQLFVPEILRAVETIVATMYKYTFGMDPWFEYTGRTPQDDAGAKAETQLVSWQMDEGNFKMRVQDSFRQMAITGLTVRKMCWDYQEVNVKRNKTSRLKTITDSLGQKKTQTIDELEVTKDNWLLDEVNLLGFYISDVATPYYDIQKAEWIGEEYEVPKHWIKKKIKTGWCVDKHYDEIEVVDNISKSNAQRLKDDLKLTSGYKNAAATKNVLIFERWGLLKAKYVYDDKQRSEMNLDEDDMVETVLMLANRKYLVKLEANPYYHGRKPYLACPYVPQEDEFAGIGVARIGQSLQEELNDTRNQTMDNKTLILMNMWLKDRAAGIKNQDLRVRPNGVIQTNSMTGLQPLRPPVLTGVGVNIEGIVKNDLRESVGAPSNLQGIAQSGVSTATESTQINSQALGRLQMTAQLYSELILKPMLVMVEYLNYQFYNQEKVISIIGEQGISFKPIAPEDIEGYKNVVIKLATDLDESPAVKRQQLIQFLTVVQQMPPQIISYHWKLLDKIYQSFFRNGHNLEDIYQAPPGQEELLDPKDENNVMLMGRKVEVKQGDDDDKHIAAHQEEFNALKYNMSQDAFTLFNEHILKHHDSKAQKLQVQAQQQMEAALAQQPQSNGSRPQGGMTNPGQIAGASAFTAPNATQTGDLSRNLGT